MDRNFLAVWAVEHAYQSLSARRAWIEIGQAEEETYLDNVALRKESVDRNTQKRHPLTQPKESLSARRAWIEIQVCCQGFGFFWCRSPQGERG